MDCPRSISSYVEHRGVCLYAVVAWANAREITTPRVCRPGLNLRVIGYVLRRKAATRQSSPTTGPNPTARSVMRTTQQILRMVPGATMSSIR